ncbi:MAG: OmpA family protein [Mediterranea massiliensis]|nr:OmpA family protein [Mediterranea massiliensis]
MKKIILLSAIALGSLTMSAQDVVQGTKITDNWSIGLTTGSTSKVTHNAILKNARPMFGLEISKQLTPIVGLGIQGVGYINTTGSATAIDASDVSMFGRINLMNLFGGYEGMPRNFEIETNTGVGWLHYYEAGQGDINSISARMGLNFNFNLGESKAWTISMRPAIVYDLQADYPNSKAQFNLNNARFELTTSFVYHFGNSNGEHFMTLAMACDPAEIAAINNEVNQLRATIVERDAELVAAAATIAEQQAIIDNMPTEITDVEIEESCTPEYVIGFRQGLSVIDLPQQANIERIANYLQENSNVIVTIKGYASPEGNAEFNQKLSEARAQAVKDVLVKHYGIDASRIMPEGLGVGDLFAEPSWNRVSICTIDTND